MPMGQRHAPKPPHSICSLTDSEGGGSTEDGVTPLQRLLDLHGEEKTRRDVMIGRRVGFYKMRGEIGSGTFSRVKLALHELTRDKVAVKILDKTRQDASAQRLLHREISSMEALQHPNVLRLYEVLETPSRLLLVLEYAAGGDLQQHVCCNGRLPDAHCKTTFAQVLSAVKYLHHSSIIHRDLKAENVLFSSSGCVKVADFGFSTRVSSRSDALDTFCGSPPYAAPELFRDESYLGPPVDVWAMGVLLFFMVTGSMPFRAETMGKLRRCIIDGSFTIPPWVPGPCQRLIKGILKPAPAERSTVDQMLGCDWLLPVEFPWSLTAHGATVGLVEQEEVRSIMEELGFTPEHLHNNQLSDRRNPVGGVYRILQHSVQRKNGCDSLPLVRGIVRDPKREGLRAYRGLRHTSKFCVIT